jgi:hypothetical protein
VLEPMALVRTPLAERTDGKVHRHGLMRQFKDLLRPLLPGQVMVIRRRRHSTAVRSQLGVLQVASHFVASRGSTVRGGPFSGLLYPVECFAVGDIVSKLVGAYEEEIHPFIEEVIRRPPRVFVDIGCAEGYYAVGIALKCPEIVVHAFDIDPAARRECRRLARLNGCSDRVRVHGRCTPRGLLGLVAKQPSFVLSDCEGGELDVFSDRVVKGLAECSALVELHHVAGQSVEREISRRFSVTHVGEFVSSRGRDPSRYPALDVLDPGGRLLALDELRVREMRWANFTPQSPRGSLLGP